jgi:citryl-CoA synthetase large subunit
VFDLICYHKQMILYEFEGKKLLQKVGIKIPQSQLISSSDDKINLNFPVVLKAQVLSGKRASVGGIVVIDSEDEFKDACQKIFDSTINQEEVNQVLVEEKVNYQSEYYLSLSYDTDQRSPVLTVSQTGGTGIEDRSDHNNYPIDITDPIESIKTISNIDKILLEELVKLFFSEDMLLLEINPLVVDESGSWIALDAKIKLDDDAKKRHEDWNYELRLPAGRVPTIREIEAKKIDEGDYRGTAGSAYFDLEGDIAILSSGGGVSLTAMDALIHEGGKPANFTEYSGNPPKEKVIKLTKIVLSKENIHGLWVVGTVAANFTDIYETLSGLIEGLREAQSELNTKFDFPIVIRRGGPRDKEAFEMLKGITDFNLILQGEETSISQSAKVMAEEAKKYAAY